jgi:hypothetical protein
MGLFLAGLCPRPAAAQELQGVSYATDAFDWPHHPRSYASESAAPEVDAASSRRNSVVAEGILVPSRSLLPRTPAPGKLARFARLAGMFMGRVSALSVGNMSICFNLELR